MHTNSNSFDYFKESVFFYETVFENLKLGVQMDIALEIASEDCWLHYSKGFNLTEFINLVHYMKSVYCVKGIYYQVDLDLYNKILNSPEFETIDGLIGNEEMLHLNSVLQFIDKTKSRAVIR